MTKKLIYLCSLILIFTSCIEDEGPSEYELQLAEDQQIIEDFLATNGKTATKNDIGFYEIEIATNTGAEALVGGEIVSVYYTMSLLDGTLIHSVQSPQLPLQILYGAGVVRPQSLELALTSLKINEKSEFYFPSGLAYVDYFDGNVIPEHANLKVEMEIVAIYDAEQQKEYEKQLALQFIEDHQLQGAEELEDGLFYVQTEPGSGTDFTEVPDFVTVDYVGTLLNGSQFDSSIDRGDPFTFQLGAGTVIQGWDIGLEGLSVGEKGLLIIPSHLAYGLNFYVAPPEIIPDLFDRGFLQPYRYQIPNYGTLVFEIEIIDIQN